MCMCQSFGEGIYRVCIFAIGVNPFHSRSFLTITLTLTLPIFSCPVELIIQGMFGGSIKTEQEWELDGCIGTRIWQKITQAFAICFSSAQFHPPETQ